MTQQPGSDLISRLRPATLFALALFAPLSMGVRQCEPVPVHDVCDYDGEHYAAGDSFKSSDGCNDCSCQDDGSVICTKRACVPQSCGGLTGAACPEKQYCDFAPEALCGAADQTGTCKARPEVCTEIYAPVCGCDDKTYGNACEAATAGVSVRKTGECAAQSSGCDYGGKHYSTGESFPSSDGCNSCSCTSDGQVACTLKACVPQSCGGIAGKACPDKQYCSFAPEAKCGAADQTGTCQPRPEVCDNLYKPVCGCDDKTYGSACEAAGAGVSVRKDGECAATSGECTYAGKPYKSGESFPSSDGCNSCSCTDGGQVVCTLRACVAACGGLTGLPCKDGQYCSYRPEDQCGAADQTGTCADKPEVCTAIYDPVCGCDGKTYGSACSAASAGMAIISKGACK